jgi:hypothetical protein
MNGHKMPQIAHVTTRPVVDEVLEEVLVIEDEIGRGFARSTFACLSI